MNYSKPPKTSDSLFVSPLNKPEGLALDWVEPKQHEFSDDENGIWRRLFARQEAMIAGRACDEHHQGIEQLEIRGEGVPELGRVNEILAALSGWELVPVPMLIPDHIFLFHLANKRFPVGNFIRTVDKFDYIEEPDVFHDMFGHVPLLANETFADYMQAFGRAGWKALRYNRLQRLSALYWYTVEFGLIGTEDHLRAYGAGILSSPGELSFSLEGISPNRVHLNVDRVMRTDYEISDLQQTYFVIESFGELYHVTEERKFDEIYKSLPSAPIYANSALIETDRIYHRGSQEYRLRGGRCSGAEAK